MSVTQTCPGLISYHLTQFSRGFRHWVLPTGNKDNPPSSNSAKQSNYKCLFLLERSFSTLSGIDITLQSKTTVEGAHVLLSPTHGITSMKSGKRWGRSKHRYRCRTRTKPVLRPSPQHFAQAASLPVIFMCGFFCSRLSARAGLMTPE